MSSKLTTTSPRQHGAMDGAEAPCDLDEVRRYRLARVRRALADRDLAGIVLYDQVNTRYATDSTNMQVWSTHNEVRYVYVPTEGPVRLFELGGETVLSDGLPGVDEVLPSIPFLYFLSGDRQAEKARAWAANLDAVIREESGGNRRIAIDRVAPTGVVEMQRLGYQVFDGFEVMEVAREVKSAERFRSCAAPSRSASSPSERCARRWILASRRIRSGRSCTWLHRPRGRMVRDAPPVLWPPHQPVVTGVVDARHRARGHGELRHRFHRALRILLRHLAFVGVRGRAHRRTAADLCGCACAD